MPPSPGSPQKHPEVQPVLIDEMLDRACRAGPSWSQLPSKARTPYIKAVRGEIVARQQTIAEAVADDTGKPVTEILSQEVTASLGMLKFMECKYPVWLKERSFRYWRPGFWSKSNTIHYERLGTVGIIGPGNFPFSLPVMQSCAALLCGNCVVIKPSEDCPRTARLIEDIFREARLPEGVLSVVEGTGDAAEQIIASTKVQKVIFTGSYETGRKVAENCGRYFKPCLLELGGDGPAIICEDANLTLAAKGIAWSGFYSNGLSCVGTKHVLVHRSIAQDFLERFRNEVKRITIGDPLQPATEFGRVQDSRALSKAKESVQMAMENRAKVFTPIGQAADVSDIDFKQPLIVVLPSNAGEKAVSQVWDAAASGSPIVTVRVIDSLEQGIRAVNGSKHGLGASIWSRHARRAQAIARQLHVGMVWINDSSVGLPQFPWGGTKKSGWGRLYTREGIYELTQVKAISHDRSRLLPGKAWWFPYSRTKFNILLAVNELFFGVRKGRALKRLVSSIRRMVM